MVADAILAYSYVRFSSKGQVGNDSERRQVEQAEEYARTLRVPLAPPMKDLGISAFKGANSVNGSALGKFYEGVRSGEIPRGSHLIVEAVDRLSREPPLKILRRLTDLIEAGIVLHILSARWVLTERTIEKDLGLLNAIVSHAQLAHTESRQKSVRISKANENRRSQARAGQKLKGPLGPAWVDTVVESGGTVSLVLNKSADAICTIFELACTGMGAPSITQRLNAAGTPVVRAYVSAERNAQRKLWYPAYVGKIISDRRTFGEYQPGKLAEDGTYKPDGEAIPDYFPAVVSHEVWLKAQQMKSAKLGRKIGGRKGTFSNLFTNGIAICFCGARMVIRTDGRRKDKPGKIDQPARHYLTCSDALHGGRCDHKRLYGYERFEQRVLNALPAIPWSSLVTPRTRPPEFATFEQEIAKAQVELQRIEKGRERVTAAIDLDEDDPIPVLLQRLKKLETDHKDVSERLRKAQEGLTLARAQATRDPGLTDELAILRTALAEPDADVLLIRQKMHEVLLGLIEYAQFDDIDSYIHVVVRGGFCIEVPKSRKKTEKTTVGWVRYHADARKRDATLNLPPMAFDTENPTELRKPLLGEPAGHPLCNFSLHEGASSNGGCTSIDIALPDLSTQQWWCLKLKPYETLHDLISWEVEAGAIRGVKPQHDRIVRGQCKEQPEMAASCTSSVHDNKD